MKKVANKFLLILIIILVSIFAGYENPGLVEIPKKYVNFLLKKIGLRDSFLNKKINEEDLTTHNEKDSIEFIGNSFSVILSKIKSYEGKSASLILKNKNSSGVEYEIFTQDGFLIKKNEASEINLPLFFYNDSRHSAGVKSVFLIEDEYFALISAKKISCLYVSLISLKNSKEIIKSNCLPDTELADFDALGGAYSKINDGILLTVGAPTHGSEIIGKHELSFIAGIACISKRNLLVALCVCGAVIPLSHKITFSFFSINAYSAAPRRSLIEAPKCLFKRIGFFDRATLVIRG